MKRRIIPTGCVITNIRRGTGARKSFVYAELRGPDGELLMSATLDYITTEIMEADILPEQQPHA